jgi:hypothetical protein
VTAPPRSALLAAWASAWAAGDATLTDVAERATAHDDAHTVEGVDPLDDRLPVDRALTRLRAGGAQTWRVVLPAPGDLVGLPRPGPFTRTATLASEGVLALRGDGTGTGLVPRITAHGSAFDGTVTTVHWTAYAVEVGADQGPFLHDAEHDLRRGISEVVEVLQDLEVARWRPEIADALMDMRKQARRGVSDDDLPGGYPARARDLLTRARQLGTVVELALEDAGGAIDTHSTEERERALRRLGGLVRRATVAAYNSYDLPR